MRHTRLQQSKGKDASASSASWSASAAVRSFREAHERPVSPAAHAWVDINRESSYHAQTAMLTRFAEQGYRSPGEYLFRLLSKDGNSEKMPPREAFDTLRLETRTYPELTALSGTEITRTIFVVQDKSVYEILEKYFGVPAGKTHGLVVHPENFTAHTSWKDTGITLVFDSPDAEATMEHETRHSLDPNLRTRTSFDNIISELFANYGEYITSGRQDWDGLIRTLVAQLYYDTYSAHAPAEVTEAINYTSWQYLILRAVTRIRAMREILSLEKSMHDVDTEIQQLLVQMKTLDELLFLEIPAPTNKRRKQRQV